MKLVGGTRAVNIIRQKKQRGSKLSNNQETTKGKAYEVSELSFTAFWIRVTVSFEYIYIYTYIFTVGPTLITEDKVKGIWMPLLKYPRPIGSSRVAHSATPTRPAQSPSRHVGLWVVSRASRGYWQTPVKNL